MTPSNHTHFSNAIEASLEMQTSQTVYQKTSEYEQNISGFKRKIKSVLMPKNTGEVQEIVRLANVHKIPLYPISCGRNWAFGSRLPVSEGSVIVDLQKMNRIHEVNTEFGYAVIEPGVTQGQLEQHLKQQNANFYLDVTGSGRETSVIGNALERGIAYNSLRADNILAHEVILGNGERLNAGYAHYQDASTQNLYKYGLGPNINALWGQSNFGIVTRATYKLIEKDEEVCFFQIRFNQKDLGQVIDKIHKLRRKEIIKGIIHIPDRNRSISSVMPNLIEKLSQTKSPTDAKLFDIEAFTASHYSHDWTAFGKLAGPRGGTQHKKKYLKAEFRKLTQLSPIGQAQSLIKQLKTSKDRMPEILRLSYKKHRTQQVQLGLFTPKQLSNLIKYFKFTNNESEKLFFELGQEFANLSVGQSSDAALKLVEWFPNPTHKTSISSPSAPRSQAQKAKTKAKTDNSSKPQTPAQSIDQAKNGLLFSVPLLPFKGQDCLAVVNLVESYKKDPHIIFAITLNTIDTEVIEAVISLSFDKSQPGRSQHAQDRLEDLYSDLKRMGHYPYRLNIDNMKQFIDSTSQHWKVINNLKKIMDPNNIISPGRYQQE